MNIYLIEDSSIFSEKLRTEVQGFANAHALWSSCNIIHVRSDYLNFIETRQKETTEKAIYIFELTNTEETGLSLAQKLRKFDFESYIIFVTSHIEMTAITYQYNLKALNFIYKSDPKFNILLKQALEQIDLELRHRSQTSSKIEQVDMDLPRLKYAYQSNYYNLKIEDILYIETHGLKRQLIIHTRDSEFNHPGPLKSIKAEVGAYFVQTHRTTLAQAKHIEHIALENGRHVAYFAKGKTCLISKNYLKDVTQAMGLF